MVPRTDGQLQSQREQTRAKILQAALSLFAREGYERTSVRMIAQEAGVAQSLLYNYFESKEALLHALFEQSMRDVYESFESLERPGDPRQRLEEYFRHSFEILRRNRDFWRLSYGVRMQPAVLAGLGDQM